MRITNRTHWRTDHLTAIIRTVAQAELDPEQWRGFRVSIAYNRGGQRRTHCSGRAPIGGHSLLVMVPSGAVDRVDLAHVLAHEMAHARGLRHRAMRTDRYSRMGAWRTRYAWAEILPLDRKPVAPAPSRIDRLTLKVDHARTHLVEWERRRKIATRKVARYSRLLKDRTRRLGLAAEQPAPA